MRLIAVLVLSVLGCAACLWLIRTVIPQSPPTLPRRFIEKPPIILTIEHDGRWAATRVEQCLSSHVDGETMTVNVGPWILELECSEIEGW